MELIKTVTVHLLIGFFLNHMSTLIGITGPVGIAGELSNTNGNELRNFM